MKSYLSTYMYLLLSASFLAFAVLLAGSIWRFVRTNGIAGKWHWTTLALIMCCAAYLRFLHTPSEFRIFYDGYEICNLAETIAKHGRFTHCSAGTLDNCEIEVMTKRPPAFAFLGGMAMKLTGRTGPEVVFAVNNALGVLCVPMLFLLVAAASRDAEAALLSAFLAAILPLHVKMSTNASTEIFNFFLICAILFFLKQFVNTGRQLDFAGMAAALHLAFFNRSENVLFFFLLPLSILGFKEDRRRIYDMFCIAWLLLVITFIPLTSVFVNIHNIHMGHMDLLYTLTPYETLARNAYYLFRNDYIPPVVAAVALGGAVWLWKSAGITARVLTAYFLLSFAVMSLVNVGLWIGDFPRLLIAMTATLFYWFGVTVVTLVKALKGRVRIAAIVSIAALLAAGLNTSPPAFHAVSKSYDRMMRDFLATAPHECSFFSPSVEVFQLYSSNRAYKIQRLLDDQFVEQHPECKIIVREFFCTLNFKEVCDLVAQKYKERIIFNSSVPGDNYTISIIEEE